MRRTTASWLGSVVASRLDRPVPDADCLGEVIAFIGRQGLRVSQMDVGFGLVSGTQVRAYSRSMADKISVLEGHSDLPATWVALDACTLPTVERPVRVAEFDALFAESLVGVEHGSDVSARFVLTGGEAVAGRARGLADR